jgi:hypothetical protein
MESNGEIIAELRCKSTGFVKKKWLSRPLLTCRPAAAEIILPSVFLSGQRQLRPLIAAWANRGSASLARLIPQSLLAARTPEMHERRRRLPARQIPHRYEEHCDNRDHKQRGVHDELPSTRNPNSRTHIYVLMHNLSASVMKR